MRERERESDRVKNEVWDVDKNRKKLIVGGELQFSHPSHKAATATVYTRYQSISVYMDRMPRGTPVHIIQSIP